MDYIDREIFINNELIPLVKRLDLCHPKQKKGVLMAIQKLNEEPTADVVEVKHGKWIKNKNVCTSPYCSVCGAVGGGSYCHHCGAKMDLEEE